MRRRIVVLVAHCSAVAGLLWAFNYFAPLQAASVAVWAGIVMTLTGLVCLIKPARRAGTAMTVAGLALIAAGQWWPAPLVRVETARYKLDEFLPEYHYYEKHTVRVHAAPERVAQALQQTTVDDIKVFFTLMRIRGLASGVVVRHTPAEQRPILELLRKPGSGFIPLHENPREIVMGMVGRPWASGHRPEVRNGAGFRAYSEPGSVRIAFNLLVEDEGGGWSRVTTETRILALDDAARRTMGRYWRVIYPGTGMIRRMWLNAIRERAEGSVA